MGNALDSARFADYICRMQEPRKPPEQCQTMADVRAGVDRLDAEIIALLGTRFGYMSAAARIKTDRSMVRDEERKAEVINNAKKAAFAEGVPVGLTVEFWDRLVEASIAFEMQKWEQVHKAN